MPGKTGILSEPMTVRELCHVENQAKLKECQNRASQRWQHWWLWGEEEARLEACRVEFDARASQCDDSTHGSAPRKPCTDALSKSPAPSVLAAAQQDDGGHTRLIILAALVGVVFLVMYKKA